MYQNSCTDYWNNRSYLKRKKNEIVITRKEERNFLQLVTESYTIRVRLYWREIESKSDIPSRWVHREFNLMLTLSSDKDQRKSSFCLMQTKTLVVLILLDQQECIPVGCVPAARRPYAGVCFPGEGEGCLRVCSWGVSALGGVCSRGVCSWGGVLGGCLLPGGLVWGGLCLLPGDGGVWSGWGLVLPGGLLPGGCLLPEGGSAPGWYPSMH